MADPRSRGYGWHRDLPDPRDLYPGHNAVRGLFAELAPAPRRSSRPRAATCEEYWPAVDDAEVSRTCTTQACLGLIAYFERRVHGRAFDGSCRFLYHMARQLLHWSGDCGVPFRVTLKALRRFGLPPRHLWPEPSGLTGEGGAEPAAFLFSYAAEFRAVTYLRLDSPGVPGARTLGAVKAFVAAGLPVAFGFPVVHSISRDPRIPYPCCFDEVLGGQAVVAVGYDDDCRVCSEKGALRVRNSWGPAWGEQGYGWLPYRYVTDQLAADFWTVVRPDWLASGEFTAPV